MSLKFWASIKEFKIKSDRKSILITHVLNNVACQFIVRGHYLFWDAYRFAWGNCELKEQTMSKDNYLSRLLKLNGAYCICYPTIFCKAFELEHHAIIPTFDAGHIDPFLPALFWSADIDKGCRYSFLTARTWLPESAWWRELWKIGATDARLSHARSRALIRRAVKRAGPSKKVWCSSTGVY